jgi:hypothetical protein
LRSFRVSLVLSLIALASLDVATAFAAEVAIGTLHCNDADGIPRTKGQSVTVSGVVTGQFSSQRNARIYVADGTGAINVYAIPKDCVPVGDSVRVTGVVTGYSGLTEISGTAEAPVKIEHFGKATRMPAPLALTLAQVNATEGADGCEANESQLVQVSGVRLLAGSGAALAPDAKFGDDTNYRLVAAAGSDTAFVVMRVTDAEGCDLSASLEGQPIPVGAALRVTGILTQYTGRGLHHGGYQILPRGRGDIAVVPPAPASAAGKQK